MNTFSFELLTELLSRLQNYHTDNHDEHLFGKNKNDVKEVIFKSLFSKKFELKSNISNYRENLQHLAGYFEKFETMYHLLEDEFSKKLLIELLLYKLLGPKKVKLYQNTPEYWKRLAQLEKSASNNKSIPSNFRNWNLSFFDLNEFGKDIKLYFTPKGILHCYFLEQYIYEQSESVKVEEGDTIIDAGGCWGDTALSFAHQTGNGGKVFCFEFIPKNLEILSKNLELNPVLQDRIDVIKRPLWSSSGVQTYYIDNGPGSKVSFEKMQNPDGEVETISIDRFVIDNKVEKIDFIKMDIEGAEIPALNGALQTIKDHKPKLAISIYHSLDDFVEIIQLIDQTNLGYKFYLGHYTIHNFETVLYAKIDK
ncbi:MAG: FkbM family methyltransferase [bacterium]|nr:FkbM family methyltransferase [bacterium]